MGRGLFIPSLLISEVYYPYSLVEGFTADLLKRVGEEDFYQAVEIGYGFSEIERKQISNTAKEQKLTVIQWLTTLIHEKNLDLSSNETKKRQEAVRRINESLYLAAECGASAIAFISGPDPGVSFRQAATESFYQSLCEICEEAATFNLEVLVEPLDREANKKRLLGPTDEAVTLFARVRESFSNIGFAFDTTHAALNREDIFAALKLAQSYIRQIHFSNAVLDPHDALYGDHHMPIGKPGFLDIDSIKAILQKAEDLGLADNGMRVAVEVRGTTQQALHENERAVRSVLETVLPSVKI